jgi:hypothetical protein
LVKGNKQETENEEKSKMAIIPLYYVVASSVDLDPDTLDIKEGMGVALNGIAGARRVTTGDDGKVFGLAGDTHSTSASSMPGVSTGWQNRVSDGYDETKASAKLTVYHGGGEFATDQFVDTNMDAAHVGQYLKVSESTGTLTLDGAAKTADSVAMLMQPAGAYPSGVPGTDINQDAELGGDNSNQYIVVKLLV